MSQSTESTTESNPFTKPGFIIAAALVVALIAAAVVIFLLPKGQDNAQPAPAHGGVQQPGHSQPQRLGSGRQERLRTALQHGDGTGSSAEVQVGTRRNHGRTHRSQNLRPGHDGR